MELKYITQDNIDEAHVNITSAEMYTEFQEYNELMLRMQKKRHKFLRDFWLLWIMNVLLAPFILLITFWGKFSLIYKLSGGMIVLCAVLVLAGEALLVYLIGIRKVYNWKTGFLITAIMVPANLYYICLAIANAVVIYLMEKTDSEIRDETGYPHFVQLSGSYKSIVKDGEVFGIESEGVYATGMKADYVVPEDPFAKYRIKPEDDMGMLADNDINNNKE